MHISATTFLPILILLVVLAADFWVYTDATRRLRQGTPASISIGFLRLETPQAWLLGCLILWVVCFPLYLTVTGRNPFSR